MIKSVYDDYHNHCDKTGDVDREGYVFGVIQTLDFDLPDGEGEN